MDRRESKLHSVSYRGQSLSSLRSGRTNSQVLASNEGRPRLAPELEACQLIVGIDFTKSNRWTGRTSFEGRNLHDIDMNGPPNPYVQVLQLAENLTLLDDDKRVPCYGFGDCETAQESVFSFCHNNEPVQGLDALVEAYKQIVPAVNMSGPTSFAPLIRQAMRDVHESGMQLHVLLILADGQISDECMEDTERAIAEAALFPLSILVIGVGDGPWEEMKKFDDDSLPHRSWDNFQFIEFNELVDVAGGAAGSEREDQFEAKVIDKINQHCKDARQQVGRINEERVLQLVNTIPNEIVIEPPSFRNL